MDWSLLFSSYGSVFTNLQVIIEILPGRSGRRSALALFPA